MSNSTADIAIRWVLSFHHYGPKHKNFYTPYTLTQTDQNIVKILLQTGRAIRFLSRRFSRVRSASASFMSPLSWRSALTSSLVAEPAVSPASRFLPASRNSFDQLIIQAFGDPLTAADVCGPVFCLKGADAGQSDRSALYFAHSCYTLRCRKTVIQLSGGVHPRTRTNYSY